MVLLLFRRALTIHRSAKALLSLLCLVVASGASEGSEEPTVEPVPQPESSSSAETRPDSLSPSRWTEEDDYEEFVPAFISDNWDSVTAAYDAAVKKEAVRRVSPEYGLRYTKAEGVHLEGGFSLGWNAIRVDRLILIGGYDIGRDRPSARGELELRLPLHDRLSLLLQGHSEIRPFGNHTPYGTTVMALLAGYDASNYLEERRGGAGLVWRVKPDAKIAIEWFRGRHAPVDVVEDWHIFGTDRWMSINDRADPLTVTGLRLALLRRPGYISETSMIGLIMEVEGHVHGGSILGGDREYGLLAANVWYTRRVRAEDTFQLRSAATLATGRAPRQALGDLGGAAGLKAFPPRGYGTPDTLIGTSRIFTRFEYRHAERLLRRTRLPIVDNLGLKLVPFVEGGAVWGDDPILHLSDLSGPARNDFLWNVGIGLRKTYDMSGILSYLQLDFAWPMGHRRGPVRIGVTLSDLGLH